MHREVRGSDGVQAPGSEARVGPRVRVWNENIHERAEEDVRRIYPEGIHGAVATGLRQHLANAEVSIGTLDEPHHGLPPDALGRTDVLVWWGHIGHDAVPDGVAAAVQQRVLDGMGLVVLHSGHLSKPFVRLMGTGCNLRYREGEDRELVWTVNPSHPIADGVPSPVVIPTQEMYGEFFDIPAPDELVFVSSFTGGEVFRSGCCFRRGKGRIFYFSPGHETHPVYHQAEVQLVIANAVRWVNQPQPSSTDTSACRDSPIGWFEN